MKPLPDLDEDYTFLQNVRFFATVLGMYLIFGPFMIADYFKSKWSAK